MYYNNNIISHIYIGLWQMSDIFNYIQLLNFVVVPACTAVRHCRLKAECY